MAPVWLACVIDKFGLKTKGRKVIGKWCAIARGEEPFWMRLPGGSNAGRRGS